MLGSVLLKKDKKYKKIHARYLKIKIKKSQNIKCFDQKQLQVA